MAKEFSNFEALQKDMAAVRDQYNAAGSINLNKMNLVPVAGSGETPVLFKQVPAGYGRYAKMGISDMAMDYMKTALRHGFDPQDLGKSSLNVAGGLTWYDLRVPALHQIPWLTPIRDKMPRKQMPRGGNAAYWKTISANALVYGGFQGDPWINEGQRAPLFSFTAAQNTAPFVSIGNDGSVTYEAEEASQSIEDANALAHFFALESLMVKEEDALIGGDNSLKLGTANTPAGTGGTDIYVQIVGLTYAGYRNQAANAIATGLVQQKVIVTPDGKTMTVNGGMGIVSTQSAHLDATHDVTWTQKAGEFAWAVYTGTVSGTLHLQGFVTVPKIVASNVFLTTPTTSGQLSSALTGTDYSVNDGSQGSGTNQVTAFDGLLVQALNANALSPSNSYVKFNAGAGLTKSGRGGVTEIDNMLLALWNQFRVTVGYIYVNAQELMNITTACLSNASAPLLRYEVSGDGENYDMTASGTVSFYFNPYLPGGGQRIPIIVHPTLPPGTILAYAEQLPAYFKSNNTPTVAEVICRRDYYAIDWAPRTREWEFGVYSSEVLAVYAPFCIAVITGIANSVA